MRGPDGPLMVRSGIEYALYGWAVFPISPGTKIPLTDHGCKDATTDPQVVAQWWARWPNANIGLATGSASRLIALDFDCKGGKSGLITRRMLHEEFQFDTLTAQTPTGGIHELFRYPGPILRNAVDRLPGLDIRTDGGYIVIAPSIVAGKHYVWTNQLPPAEMAPGMIDLIRPLEPLPIQCRSFPRPSNRMELVERASRYVAAVPGAIQGRAGDVTTYKLACRLVRGFALTDNEAFLVLWSWNLRCNPLWTERELIAKIASARRNGIEPFGERARA